MSAHLRLYPKPNPKPKPKPNPSPYRQQQGGDDAGAALQEAELLEAELHGVGGLVARRVGGSVQQLDLVRVRVRVRG